MFLPLTWANVSIDSVDVITQNYKSAGRFFVLLTGILNRPGFSSMLFYFRELIDVLHTKNACCHKYNALTCSFLNTLST